MWLHPFLLQVLSESVSKALELSGEEDVTETVRFVAMVDKWFDALNVHNYTHGVHARKTFQLPYTSGHDRRLKVNASVLLHVLSKLSQFLWGYHSYHFFLAVVDRG